MYKPPKPVTKKAKNGKFTSNYKASQSILKHKFPFVDKPLRI